VLQMGNIRALPSNIRPGANPIKLFTNFRNKLECLDKHPSLSRTLVNYGRKEFYYIGPRLEVAYSDTFTSVKNCIVNYHCEKFYSTGLFGF